MNDSTTLSLYYFKTCPFCMRVLLAIKTMGLSEKIELRNKRKNPEYEKELTQATGVTTVPCLRIQDNENRDEWLHESSDIIAWLEKHAHKAD